MLRQSSDVLYYTCSKVVRKSIARVLTVISQNQRSALRKAYTNKVRLLEHEQEACIIPQRLTTAVLAHGDCAVSTTALW